LPSFDPSLAGMSEPFAALSQQSIRLSFRHSSRWLWSDRNSIAWIGRVSIRSAKVATFRNCAGSGFSGARRGEG
jgi:hypothetical protein